MGLYVPSRSYELILTQQEDAAREQELAEGTPGDAAADFLVSALVVDAHGFVDHVRVWSRGVLVGTLTLSLGDGLRLARRLGLKLHAHEE